MTDRTADAAVQLFDAKATAWRSRTVYRHPELAKGMAWKLFPGLRVS